MFFVLEDVATLYACVPKYFERQEGSFHLHSRIVCFLEEMETR